MWCEPAFPPSAQRCRVTRESRYRGGAPSSSGAGSLLQPHLLPPFYWGCQAAVLHPKEAHWRAHCILCTSQASFLIYFLGLSPLFSSPPSFSFSERRLDKRVSLNSSVVFLAACLFILFHSQCRETKIKTKIQISCKIGKSMISGLAGLPEAQKCEKQEKKNFFLK